MHKKLNVEKFLALNIEDERSRTFNFLMNPKHDVVYEGMCNAKDRKYVGDHQF